MRRVKLLGSFFISAFVALIATACSHSGNSAASNDATPGVASASDSSANGVSSTAIATPLTGYFVDQSGNTTVGLDSNSHWWLQNKAAPNLTLEGNYEIDGDHLILHNYQAAPDAQAKKLDDAQAADFSTYLVSPNGTSLTGVNKNKLHLSRRGAYREPAPTT